MVITYAYFICSYLLSLLHLIVNNNNEGLLIAGCLRAVKVSEAFPLHRQL